MVAVLLLGIESRPLVRYGQVPADGPDRWTSGTLFPRSSKKVARAINAASGRLIMGWFDVDEATWALAEVGWMTRIARKAFAGDPSLMDAYRAAGDDELARLGASRPVPSRAIWLRSEELRAAGKTDGQIARALDLPVFDLARMRLAHARAGA